MKAHGGRSRAFDGYSRSDLDVFPTAIITADEPYDIVATGRYGIKGKFPIVI